MISRATLDDELRRTGATRISLHLFDELPSTSRWLETHVSGADAVSSPALCAVDLQSDGSGRRGKGWVSVRGNVAMSLFERVLHPPAGLSGLSLVTGIAVADVLRDFCAVDVRIKWPNDLLVDGAKVGGLLTQVQVCPHSASKIVDSDGRTTVVISGIGINLIDDPRVTDLGIGGTSLAAAGAAPIDRDRLLGRIASVVLAEHARFRESGWSAFAERWIPLDALKDREVDVLRGAGRERGTALGVNGDGALRVRVDGVEKAVYGGEVSVRPTIKGLSA